MPQLITKSSSSFMPKQPTESSKTQQKKKKRKIKIKIENNYSRMPLFIQPQPQIKPSCLTHDDGQELLNRLQTFYKHHEP